MVNTEIKLIIFFAAKRWRSAIQSAKTRLGADCGSDHEFLIAKFRLKLKKVGETIRSFRYDLNQVPYNYTVEVRNRCKTRDLLEKIRDTKGKYHAKMGSIKDRNGMDLTEGEDIKKRRQEHRRTVHKKIFMIHITTMV